MKLFLTLIVSIIFLRSFSQTAIDTTEVLVIGKIKQFISVKGKDNSKPLLLFLHGGPGGSVMNSADRFTAKLQEEFLVINWDQRETGKTLALNSSPVPLTLNLFQTDTHDLIDSLLKQFNRQKLYLAGHSWGTVLGFFIADKHPELLYAFIAISPVVDELKSEQMSLDMLKEKAGKDNNKKAMEELSKVNIPFENGEQLYYHRKWLFTFDGQKINARAFPKSFVLSWCDRWFDVWMEAGRINFTESIPGLKCPVYFFVGRHDYQTNYSISEAYFNKLTAPVKQLFWFENSGHLIPTSEPGLMQQIIIEKILPQTYTR